jgi:PAS domain S-box-containing protein
VAGTVGYDWNLCIGVRSDNPVLYSVIAKALNSLPKTKRDEIYRKWISLAPRPVYYEIQFWYIIASILLGVSIIILVIIGWNTSLRKQVAIKTQQLENELQLHKKTQEQLLLEKERLFITIQSIGDIFIITDNEGNVILANKQAETVFGKAVVSGGCLYSSITFIDPNAQHTVNPIDACMQSGNVTTFYHCICRYDDRSFDVSVVSSPIIIEDTVTGVVTIMRDISTMLAMQNELIKLQQFESLGILGAGIAHDFNNILMAIMGNTELLGAVLKNTGNVNDSTRITEGIKKSVKSAQSLTAQLLTYARGGKPIKQTGNIVQLLKDTVDFMASGTGIKINYNIDSYDYEFDFDENQLSHVLRNLTLNAVQAMGSRGVLTIKVLEESMDNANTIQLPSGNYVKIQFIDTGRGIPPEHVNKIFDPYFTTKENGSGLGLTTSLSIVKQHGGTMTVSSSHEGTTFSVYLPKVKQVQVNDTAMAHEVASPNAVVLVIDDRQDIIEVTTGMLDILGYSYDWAYSGNEAIAKLVEGKNKNHLFDCVLVDVTIPGGMSGVEAFAKMKTIQPLLKGIVMSGYADNNAIAEYDRFGFSWYLVKPFTLSDLKLALLKALL